MIKLSTIFMILGILLFMLFGYMHESAHVEIYKTYGIKSHVSIDFPHAITIPEGNINTLMKCDEQCRLAHDINEAISYPLMAFFLLFFFGFTISIILLEFHNPPVIRFNPTYEADNSPDLLNIRRTGQV